MREAELPGRRIDRPSLSSCLGALRDLGVVSGENFVGHDRRRLGLRYGWVGPGSEPARTGSLRGEHDAAREPVAPAPACHLREDRQTDSDPENSHDGEGNDSRQEPAAW